MAFIVIALDYRVLDGAVHPLGLSVRPRMIDLGEALLIAVLAAAHVEHVRDVAGSRAISTARGQPELDAVVGEHRVDLGGHSRSQSDLEGRGGDPVALLHQL